MANLQESGVPPDSRVRVMTHEHGFGGTPKVARETRALPFDTAKAIRSAEEM